MCQRSKISSHNQLQPQKITVHDNRFDHVHIDLVGPLLTAQGFKYCLNMIERFSRWPETIPLVEVSADTVAKAFFAVWVALYGAPKVISADEAGSSRELCLTLFQISSVQSAFARQHTQANGLIERWHRTLKSSITCHASTDWVEVSVELLGFRTSIKEELNVSAADILYGKTLRVPGEFFDSEELPSDSNSFVKLLRRLLQKFRPVPTKHHQNVKTFVFTNLSSCSHVFLREDAVKRPLDPPYSGPFKVLRRISDRVFEIDVNGKASTITVERLKPAHLPVGHDQPPVVVVVLPPANPDPSTSSSPVTSSPANTNIPASVSSAGTNNNNGSTDSSSKPSPNTAPDFILPSQGSNPRTYPAAKRKRRLSFSNKTRINLFISDEDTVLVL